MPLHASRPTDALGDEVSVRPGVRPVGRAQVVRRFRRGVRGREWASIATSRRGAKQVRAPEAADRREGSTAITKVVYKLEGRYWHRSAGP